MKATHMAKAADGNLGRPTKICQGGSHTNLGNKLIRSPPRPYLPPAMAGKWAHVQRMKLPNEIGNDAKLKELAYDKPRASLLLMPTNCERLTPKENDESPTWAGRKPPEVAEIQHLLELEAR